MTNSTLFENLKQRIQDLENIFLTFPDIDAYRDPNQDKIKAFCLLSHAEIEDYFEKICKVAIKELTKGIDYESFTYSKISPLLHFPTSKYSGGDDDNLISRIKQISSSYLHEIGSNNGIRQTNILKLLLPLGIGIDLIDPTWLLQIDNFGDLRGQFAHKGKQSIRIRKDKITILDTLNNQIMVGIEYLDIIILRKLNLSCVIS